VSLSSLSVKLGSCPAGRGKPLVDRFSPKRTRSTRAFILGEVAQYENIFRLCNLRGPSGIIVALAERIG
jgi:hypothetical protein